MNSKVNHLKISAVVLDIMGKEIIKMLINYVNQLCKKY